MGGRADIVNIDACGKVRLSNGQRRRQQGFGSYLQLQTAFSLLTQKTVVCHSNLLPRDLLVREKQSDEQCNGRASAVPSKASNPTTLHLTLMVACSFRFVASIASNFGMAVKKAEQYVRREQLANHHLACLLHQTWRPEPLSARTRTLCVLKLEEGTLQHIFRINVLDTQKVQHHVVR